MSKSLRRTQRGALVACVAAALTFIGMSAPALAQERPPDACPNGYSTEQTVGFASSRQSGRSPSSREVDSGVVNVSRADGCTLLDVIWNAEPFATGSQFLNAV